MDRLDKTPRFESSRIRMNDWTISRSRDGETSRQARLPDCQTGEAIVNETDRNKRGRETVKKSRK